MSALRLSIGREKKRKPKREHPESDEQTAFFQWLAMAYPEIYKVATASGAGGKRNAREAARLKREGLKAGFPDIMIFWPTRDFHGLFIELKRPSAKGRRGGVCTALQKETIQNLTSLGYAAGVCWGWDEARNLTNAYLAPITPRFP